MSAQDIIYSDISRNDRMLIEIYTVRYFGSDICQIKLICTGQP